MKTSTSITKKNDGFSLIEVMVAVLVLSIGILAVSKLQGNLIKSGSNANTRTVAATLAEKKIDDLRRFKDAINTIAWTPTLTTPTSIFYRQITDNEGGLIPPGSHTVGNVIYNLSWDVTDYIFNSVTSPASATTTATSPDYKMLSVTVSWDDPAQSLRQSIVLDTTIDSNNPGTVKLASVDSDFGSESPPLKHTPYTAPDVVPIALSGSLLRETSKPTPDISFKGDSTVVGFETITYNVSFDVLRLEDFRTAACKCKSIKTDSDISHTFGTTTWDSTNQIVIDDTYEITGGTTAVLDDSGPDTQSADCYTCCADGYKYSDTSNTTLSCRMKRVDGILRVFEPWKMIGYNMIPASYFDDSVNGLDMNTTLQTQNISTYSNYVVSLVRNTIKNYPSASALAALSTVDSTFPTVANSYVNSGPVTHTHINGLNTIRPLQVRTVYMDYPPVGAFEGTTYTATNIPLDRILFYEINMTQLAGWIPDDDGDTAFDSDYTDNHDSLPNSGGYAPVSSNNVCKDASVNCVTNQELTDGGEYSRGEFRTSVTNLNTPTTVKTQMFTSNDGVVNRRINYISSSTNFNTTITIPLEITVSN